MKREERMHEGYERMHESNQRMHEMHRAHGQYEHEEDRPKVAEAGHMLHGMSCDDYKTQAHPIAYGQASESGCKSDNKKIHSQGKDYHWS